MVITSEVVIRALAVAHLKNGDIHQGLELARFDPQQNKEIVKLLFKPFNVAEKFAFRTRPGSLSERMQVAFENPDQLTSIGEGLLAQLLECGIAPGTSAYFVICYLEDCVIDDEVTDAIGIYLLESKNAFIKIDHHAHGFSLAALKGISPTKIQRGVLVFNSRSEHGFESLIVDKSAEGEHWQKDFLGLEKIKDDYFQTQVLINDIQEFAQNSYSPEEKQDKIALVNESIEYIKSNDFFDQEEFEERVLKEPELIDGFERFRQEKAGQDEEVLLTNFEISKPAIQKTKRYIRSVIKLDKNFHVYVHGNRENIVKGYDEGLKKHFYTLYFEEEA